MSFPEITIGFSAGGLDVLVCRKMRYGVKSEGDEGKKWKGEGAGGFPD